MNPRIAIVHNRDLRFERRLDIGTHWLRLRPAPHCPAQVSAYSLRIHGEPHFLNWTRDPFGNHLARLDLPEPITSLAFTMELVVDLAPVNPFDFLLEPGAVRSPFVYEEQLAKELAPYRQMPPVGPLLRDWLAASGVEEAETLDWISQHVYRVHRSLPIDGAIQPGPVDAERVLTRGRACAWESAWMLVLSLRQQGLAARFVSGYRVVLLNDDRPDGGVSPLSGGSSELASIHAWAEVYLPGAGWVGLDPASGLFTDQSYIPLAATPEPRRAFLWTCEEALPPATVSESITARRLVERRQIGPYSPSQWSDLGLAGQAVDAALAEQAIDLHTGQSVCLVAAHVGDPEWSVRALGPSKRAAGEELLGRLRQRWAPGGLILESQGEWFGGEALPRWRLNGYFRCDGQALIRAARVWPSPGAPVQPEVPDAEYFAQTLARKLGLQPSQLLPAYEDQLHELWSQRLPPHCAPAAADLRDPLRRQLLARELSRSQLPPTGYVLPLRWDRGAKAWRGGPWRFRRADLFLIPGASPMGYRLPLEGLAIEDDADARDPERCPLEDRDVLPGVHGELSARLTTYLDVAAPAEFADPDGAGPAPRTALCFQVRNGRLYVFLPPLTHLEHFLDLVEAIEATAFTLGIPVLLEGYEPPEDFRLARFSVEPEAGVLRVRLPASGDFGSIAQYLEGVYAEAAAMGLRGERVAEDGTRQAPDGVADLTLSGPSPASSPFLSRPRLLRALIACWQRHPSLSYLFAGRLIGPSGPAPRPDEGRADALYELDLALARLPQGDSHAPWLADRALRHLLADPAGDMRRAEIRVDELYGPDYASQRLGRVALRPFATAPNARLAAARTLLVRALIAHFARNPAPLPLLDWGPALHDRMLLPTLLWEDLTGLLATLRAGGLPIQDDWFEPLLEFRFPSLGRVASGSVSVDLRVAHEPWPVLAEEVTGSGLARLIDSANQRVQVSVQGMIPGVHVLLCNGRRIPLQSTAVTGTWVAGVRFKAWSPIATLRPMLPPVGSLDFELVDGRNGALLCGFNYVPPQPGFAGAVALPTLPPGGEHGEPWRARPIELDLPPWSPGGRFSAGGGATPRLPLPPLTADPDMPYLLDLTSAD